jgi:hypothetical protein
MRRQCVPCRKNGYDTEREARDSSKDQARHPGQPKRLRVYEAPCGLWHLTSYTRKRDRARYR